MPSHLVAQATDYGRVFMPPRAAGGGGGGGAAATAADTATAVMFAIYLTRGVLSEATASPVVKVLQNGDIRYHTESGPSNVGLPCASYCKRAVHVLRYTTALPAAVVSA